MSSPGVPPVKPGYGPRYPVTWDLSLQNTEEMSFCCSGRQVPGVWRRFLTLGLKRLILRLCPTPQDTQCTPSPWLSQYPFPGPMGP